MWNPFKKSKVKQLKEIAAEAIVNHLYDSCEKYTEKLLANKDADSKKIYQMLASNCVIAGVCNDTKNLLFVTNYTYRIERINEKVYDSNLETEIDVPRYYKFIISGDLYYDTFKELTRTIKLVIRNINDREDVFAVIGNLQLSNEAGECPTVKADIIFHTPFKEEIKSDEIISKYIDPEL